MMKSKAQRDDETMVLADAVKVLMAVKGCSAQVAFDELIEANRRGEMPIMAHLVKMPKDGTEDCSD